MFNATRRLLLKSSLVLGGAALLGLNTATKAVASAKELKEWMLDRIHSVYKADLAFPARASQDNKQVQLLYKNFLGAPGGELSHKYLHMHFADRSANIKKLAAQGQYPNPRAEEFDSLVYPYEDGVKVPDL